MRILAKLIIMLGYIFLTFIGSILLAILFVIMPALIWFMDTKELENKIIRDIFKK